MLLEGIGNGSSHDHKRERCSPIEPISLFESLNSPDQKLTSSNAARLLAVLFLLSFIQYVHVAAYYHVLKVHALTRKNIEIRKQRRRVNRAKYVGRSFDYIFNREERSKESQLYNDDDNEVLSPGTHIRSEQNVFYVINRFDEYERSGRRIRTFENIEKPAITRT